MSAHNHLDPEDFIDADVMDVFEEEGERYGKDDYAEKEQRKNWGEWDQEEQEDELLRYPRFLED